MFAVFMIILFCSCQKNYKYGNNELDSSDSENKPYLEIVGAKYIDKKDKSKGVINLYCLYSIEEDKTIMKEELLPAKGYPVSCLDPNTKKYIIVQVRVTMIMKTYLSMIEVINQTIN